MDIRFQVIGIALLILLVIIILAFKYLSSKQRLILFGVILAAAIITWVVVTINLNYLPTSLALEKVYTETEWPVQLSVFPGQPDTLYYVSKKGRVFLIQDGQQLSGPFLDIEHIVDSEGSEQGLLNVQFHPDYIENGRFYVYYSNMEHDTVLVRYQVSANNPLQAEPDSAEEILYIPQLNTTYHNGGGMTFGPEGYLYLGVGNSGDKTLGEAAVSQDLSSLLGKLLRLDVNDPSVPYKVPEDNPFINDANALPEIWSYGLRNPWRISFDFATGNLYISDVGEGLREEVNFQFAGEGGANYGWPYYEGTSQYDEESNFNKNELVFPVAEFDHLALGGCSIIGGDVYYGEAIPDLRGKYLYSDFCTGFVWAVEIDNEGKGTVERLMKAENVRISSFGTDHDGELYLLDLVSGDIYKIIEK